MDAVILAAAVAFLGGLLAIAANDRMDGDL